jgi:hypothetical protein
VTVVAEDQSNAVSSVFRISRVVGPGRGNDIDAVGRFREEIWPTYWQNHVVSEKAHLKLHASMSIDQSWLDLRAVDFWAGPLTVTVTVRFDVNGNEIASHTFPPQVFTAANPTARAVDPWDECVGFTAQDLVFARLKGADSSCTALPGETTCPGINVVSARYEVKTQQNIHDPFTGVPVWVDLPSLSFALPSYLPESGYIRGRAELLTFEAMEPVILITGCCGEDSDFWNNTAVGQTLFQEFTDRRIPFADRSNTTKKGMLEGTIEGGGGVLSKQIPKIAKAFGSNWVHLVAHSKGGLNSRWLLGQKGWLESQGVGVLSLITLDTPHDGSLGGDAVFAMINDAGLRPDFPSTWVNLALLKNRIPNEQKYGTQFDLRTGRLKNFNQDHPKPPGSMTVSSITKPLALWALTSDANSDNSANGSWRTIDNSEARAWPGGPFHAYVLEGFYNMIGTTTRLTTVIADIGDGVPRKYLRPASSPRYFLLNDGVVTAGSQSYESHPGTFTSLMTEQNGGLRIYGSNHNSVPDSVVASRIVDMISSTR